jgi:hypothetical protein
MLVMPTSETSHSTSLEIGFLYCFHEASLYHRSDGADKIYGFRGEDAGI